jgi:atypical dual specificity phosphatase
MRIEQLPGDSGGGGGDGGGGGGGGALLQLRRGAAAAAAAVEEEGGVVMRVAFDAKRAAVGVGARMLFYPTLVYNVVRNRFEPHFHWWDQVDEVGKISYPLF